MNIVDLVLFQCRLQPPAPAMHAPGSGIGLISYGRLERAIYNIARHARSLGLARGNVVGLHVEDPILHGALILGLGHVGVVTFSRHTAAHPRELRIDALISDRPAPTSNAEKVLVADAAWIEGDGRPLELSAAERGGGSDLCRIVLTSGTTGDPKAVALSHDKALARIARHGAAFGNRLPDCSRVHIDLGLSTSLGYAFLIQMLARGGTVFFRGPDAVETMQAFDLYKVQAMVAAPAGLAEYLELYEAAPQFPPVLDVIVSGGSLLARTLSDRVRSRMCRDLVSAYGSTETSMVAAAPAQAIAHAEGAVGYVMPGIAVEIVGSRDTPVPCGEEGVVRIRSEFAVDGYLGDAPGSNRAFREGWFYPGDLGALNADGLLVLSGRQKSVVNIGGDKLSAERIEQVLKAFPGINGAAAVGMANGLGIEEVHAAIVATDLDEEALHAHCARRLPRSFRPVRYLRVSTIPLNQMGKIDRSRLPSLFRSGSQP